MEMTSSDRMVIRQFPFFGWVVGIVFLGMGLFALGQKQTTPGLVMIAIGILIAVILSPVTIITADKALRTLVFDRWRLFVRSRKTYSLDDIATVKLESSSVRHDMQTRRVYRVVLVLKSGQVVPVQGSYTGAYRRRLEMAQTLRGFVGVPLEEPMSEMQAAWKVATQVMSMGQSQTGLTDGVSWQVNCLPIAGRTMMRWISSDFTYPGEFLFLSQTPRGSGEFRGPGGLVGSLAHVVYQQMLAMYGFGPDDTPHLDAAVPVEVQDPFLAASFATLASDPSTAADLLQPGVVAGLGQWAARHPVSRVQKPSQGGPLAVLFSPNGVYVSAAPGSKGEATPEQIEELARLGAMLVRANQEKA